MYRRAVPDGGDAPADLEDVEPDDDDDDDDGDNDEGDSADDEAGDYVPAALLPVNAASVETHVPAQTIRNWARTHRIRSERGPNRTLLVYPVEIAAVDAQRRAEGVPTGFPLRRNAGGSAGGAAGGVAGGRLGGFGGAVGGSASGFTGGSGVRSAEELIEERRRLEAETGRIEALARREITRLNVRGAAIREEAESIVEGMVDDLVAQGYVSAALGRYVVREALDLVVTQCAWDAPRPAEFAEMLDVISEDLEGIVADRLGWALKFRGLLPRGGIDELLGR
jgi:hypothetical protein